jgi:uncharacterized low-complexity protein
MLKKTIKPVSLAAGLALAGSLAGVSVAQADTNPFGMTALSSGYMAMSSHSEGKCGEGKCGEGKCGGDKEDKDSEGKCGEGKCGGDKEDKDSEGKCGEGKCGGDKA